MNSLLLDADVIIYLHKFNAWKKVTSDNQVFVPSIVIHNEVVYYEDADGIRFTLDLINEIHNGVIKELAASAKELSDFTERFDSVFQGDLHNGEKEGLFFLEKQPELRYCTCDKSAIMAMALLGLNDQGIALEEVLSKSGLTKDIQFLHTQKYFKQHLAKGSTMKIYGQGLDSS